MTPAPTTAALSLAIRIEQAIALAPERIREAFGLFDVVETTGVETASIGGDVQPVLRINPDWVAHHAPTREKLLMLLLHEALHVLLGHTRLFPLCTEADNVVLDSVINALLCRLFPDTACTALFTDYYDDRAFPDCFLRPAPRWSPRTVGDVPAALLFEGRHEAAQVYRALYSDRSVPTADLYRVLGDAETPGLIGSHGAGDGNADDSPSPLLREIAAGIAGDLSERTGSAGALLSDLLRAITVKPVTPPPSDRQALVRILRTLGRNLVPVPPPARRQGIDVASVHTAIPGPDRRATVLRSLGTEPLFYAGEFTSPSRTPLGERIHVYLDVSGSVADVRGSLYGAVLAAKDLVFPVVHLFSNSVEDVTLGEMRRGVCRSTDGTSLEPVAAHAERNRVRRALVVTDGEVGSISREAVRILSRLRLGVALVQATHPSDRLLGLARVRTTLNGEERPRPSANGARPQAPFFSTRSSQSFR